MLQVEGATGEWSFMQNDGWMNGWMVGGAHSIHSSIHQLWAPPTIHPSIHPIVDGWINHLTSQKVDVLKFWMHTMEVLLPDKSNNRHHHHHHHQEHHPWWHCHGSSMSPVATTFLRAIQLSKKPHPNLLWQDCTVPTDMRSLLYEACDDG